MALTLLPEEILELIVDKFDIKDLLACSAVSLEWRETFNNNVFWRKFCIKGIKDYLKNIHCQVEPTFVVPEQHEERLQPLCTWRIHYMRNVHLLNNWKSGRYSLANFRSYAGVVSSEVKFDCEGIHWLFIRTESDIEIWNIHTVPQLFATFPIILNCPNVNIMVAGKRAIITQWNIVNVYDLQSSTELFRTVFRFVVEGEKLLTPAFWNLTDETEIDFLNKGDYFRFENFGKLLVGYKQVPNPQSDLSMHIWDVTTGEKLKTESMLHSLCDGNEFDFINILKIDEIKGLIRLIFRSPQEVLYSQLYIYDFVKQKFTDIDIMFEGAVVWCGCTQDIIVTFTYHSGIIEFYNLLSGKLLSEIEIGIYTNSEQIQLIDSYLLYGMFNCINVLNIHNQEVVYCHEFSIYSFVQRLTVIEPRFVVVWLRKQGGSLRSPNYYQEVWDMKDLGNKLFQCSSELESEIVTDSSSIIKQVISKNGFIYLYTFW